MCNGPNKIGVYLLPVEQHWVSEFAVNSVVLIHTILQGLRLMDNSAMASA